MLLVLLIKQSSYVIVKNEVLERKKDNSIICYSFIFHYIQVDTKGYFWSVT